jgi:hypothetical protein
LLDNASAEFAFIREFFKSEAFIPVLLPPRRVDSAGEADNLSNGRSASDIDGLRSPGGETESTALPRNAHANGVGSRADVKVDIASSEEKKILEGVWKQVFDPVLPYVQVSWDIYRGLPDVTQISHSYTDAYILLSFPFAATTDTSLDHDTGH